MKDMLRKGLGAEKIRTSLQEYVDSLKSEFSEGLILPSNASDSQLKVRCSTTKRGGRG